MTSQNNKALEYALHFRSAIENALEARDINFGRFRIFRMDAATMSAICLPNICSSTE